LWKPNRVYAQIPALYGYREHVDDGGQVSYDLDLRECSRRGAYHVDIIIKGVARSDLPVEFHQARMVIGLETARALSPTISSPRLSRAEEVVEQELVCCSA
jgi:putative ABC transport system substrate-binding protein